MINVTSKTVTLRRAKAQGTIWVGAKAYQAIENNQIVKGCPKIIAEIAGIQGAKQTAHSIPLCHPLSLNSIDINIQANAADYSYTVICTVTTEAKTGVEMEALSGVNNALLTFYDLTKIVEPALEIGNVHLVFKEGGKHGVWSHPKQAALSHDYTVKKKDIDLSSYTLGMITLSDRAFNGVYQDLSQPKIKELVQSSGIACLEGELIPDNPEKLKQAVINLVKRGADWIITTGGTGLGNRDITYQTLSALCEEAIPGLAEKLRQESARYTQYAWISRMYAGIYQRCLIIALPGNPKAIVQLMPVLIEMMPHTLKLLRGRD